MRKSLNADNQYVHMCLLQGVFVLIINLFTFPSYRGFLTELQTEAEYYQISGLKELINDVLKSVSGESPPSTHKSSKRAHRKVAMLKHPPSPPQTQNKDS